MTALTPTEVTAARAIAALLVGCRRDVVLRSCVAARNRMFANLLLAGWDLLPATHHACAFSEAIAAQLVNALPERLQ